MKKQQYRRTRRRSAGVHLSGAARGRNDEPIGVRGSRCQRAVVAAAVDDEDFDAAFAKRRQRRQEPDDDATFIQHRDNDRQTSARQHVRRCGLLDDVHPARRDAR